MRKFLIKLVGCSLCFYAPFLLGIEDEDRSSIEMIVQGYAKAWSEQEGRGFAKHFAEDADFVNIFGGYFSGRAEIEKRHLIILQTFLKGSKMRIMDMSLREVKKDLVIALVRWSLEECPKEEIKNGIFTQIFIKNGDNWEIAASQNTLIPNG